MKLTREAAAVIAMKEACAQICYKRGISVCGHLIRSLDPADFIEKGNSVHLAKPLAETATDTKLEAVVRASFMKSKLFKMFTEQSFWHANYVNLQWRYNGKYVHEEADWIKDIWYAMRGHNPGELNAQSGVSPPNTAGQPNEQNDTTAFSEQCVSSSGPIGCYRVRCHLGKVCAAIGSNKDAS